MPELLPPSHLFVSRYMLPLRSDATLSKSQKEPTDDENPEALVKHPVVSAFECLDDLGLAFSSRFFPFGIAIKTCELLLP